MSKTAFAQSIISKLKAAIGTDGSAYNSGSATSAMAAVASAITEYLIANTKVSVAYVGTLTSVPPAPDPLVSDTFTLVGSCAPPGPSNGFDAWIHQIEANIIAGFQLSPKGNAGLIFVQAPFLASGILTTQSMLTAIHDVSDTDPQQNIWETVCEGIMNWINTTAFNPAPGAASNPAGPSTGMANIVKITVT